MRNYLNAPECYAQALRRLDECRQRRRVIIKLLRERQLLDIDPSSLEELLSCLNERIALAEYHLQTLAQIWQRQTRPQRDTRHRHPLNRKA